MQLPYPSSPLYARKPDELYAEEYSAAVDAGFVVALFSYEDFLAGDFRSRPALLAEQKVLYRGWMLTPAQYTKLHGAVAACGAAMLTSPEQYERCHYLPGWYAELQQFTPETRFFQESDDISSGLREISWTGCFLKDYVKSLSTAQGSMVRDLSQIPEVIDKMKAYRGEIEGGICARRIEDFEPETEERYFVYRGTPHARDGRVPEVVKIAAQRIDSPFFTVDTILRRDGVTRIVELGDGQVSDRKKWTAQQLLNILHSNSEQCASPL